jgi:two-component system, OmpR family, sensor kinase
LRISPLRIWLQSTSLLAVVAGYSLLLLFNQQIAFQQRTAAHLQLAEQLVAELGSRASERSQLQPLLNAALLPGLRLCLCRPPARLPCKAAAARSGW